MLVIPLAATQSFTLLVSHSLSFDHSQIFVLPPPVDSQLRNGCNRSRISLCCRRTPFLYPSIQPHSPACAAFSALSFISFFEDVVRSVGGAAHSISPLQSLHPR